MQWVKLAEGVDESVYEGDKVGRHGIKDLKIRGVYGNRVYRRFYPHNSLAAHVIGYVNQDGTPAAGVERYMDFFLRGQNGWRESERNGRRQELAQFQTREVPPIDGYDVTLSIDMYIQHMVEAELQRIADEYAPLKATIIVSDARTGFLLGLANYPTFNLNEFNKAPLDALRNYAVADVFEPGSTFKIVAASGALNDRLVTPDSAFDCRHRRGGLPRAPPAAAAGRSSGPDAHRGRDHQSFQQPGRGPAGHAAGRPALLRYTRAFGFGEKTGFPFGGEVDGLLAPPRDWDGLTITRMPMGQSVAATPLQMHYAMAVIADGGVLLRPQLFREVRDEPRQAGV